MTGTIILPFVIVFLVTYFIYSMNKDFSTMHVVAKLVSIAVLSGISLFFEAETITGILTILFFINVLQLPSRRQEDIMTDE